MDERPFPLLTEEKTTPPAAAPAGGDSLRWIHWLVSAHQDSLYVRPFDQDATGDI